MKTAALKLLSLMLLLSQFTAAIRVCIRLARTANGVTIHRVEVAGDTSREVSILIPVLNEEARLAPCLEGALAQGSSVREIIVIDGGSTDQTCKLVRQFAERDGRVQLVQAGQSPANANGKAWQLQKGFEQTSIHAEWILTLDADVRPDPLLVRSLLAHAQSSGVSALSVATRQTLSGRSEGIIHPAMLATLVYRFGIPGHATRNVDRVLANGQCFFVRKDILDSVAGFDGVLHSISEDVTLARAIAAAGHPVGFYESDRLVSVEMYAGAREAWNNWTRSLPMRDRYSPHSQSAGMIDVLLTQALPMWILLAAGKRFRTSHPLFRLNGGLICVRFGVLVGMARAYNQKPWTYWLSPLADLPVALHIINTSRKNHHVWRGRTVVSGESV